MTIKPKAKRPGPLGNSKSDFAEAVIALYKWGLRNPLAPFSNGIYNNFSKCNQREVREVAFGLVMLHHACDRAAESLSKKPAKRRVESGISEAYAIIDALTTGLAHPIQRYMTSLRSIKYRPQSAPAGRIKQRRRESVVGFVLAYQKAAGVLQSVAIRDVLKVCHSNEFRLESGAVRQWVARFGGNEGAQEFSRKITAEAKAAARNGPVAPEILTAGRWTVWEEWSVPEAWPGL